MITSRFPSLPKVPTELPDEAATIEYLTKFRGRVVDELSIVRKALERADNLAQKVAEHLDDDSITIWSLPKQRIISSGYSVSDFAPADHHILSVSHGDTTAAAVVRGDIITGQGATPVWARLAKGAAGTVLSSGADEPAWATTASLLGSGTDNYIPKFVTGATPTFGDSIMSNAVAGVISCEGDFVLNADALGENRTLTIEGWDGVDMAAFTAQMDDAGKIRFTVDGNRFIHEYGYQNLFIGRGSGNYTLNTGTGFVNLGLGLDTLTHLTTGQYNVALGKEAGHAITDGQSNFCCGVGAGTRIASGNSNTLLGRDAALYSGATGDFSYNTAIGHSALGGTATYYVTSYANTAIGYQSCVNLTGTAKYNTAVGYLSGPYQVAVDHNVCIGALAGRNSAASNKLFIHSSAAATNYSLIEGDFGTGVLVTSCDNAVTNAVTNQFLIRHTSSGTPAAGFGGGILGQLESSTTDHQDAAQIAWSWTDATHATRTSKVEIFNVINGTLTGFIHSPYAITNLFVGHQSGNRTTTGDDNIGLGYQTLLGISSGDRNFCCGSSAGYQINTGSDNFILGWHAGLSLQSGSQNFAMGNTALAAVVSTTRNIAIGHQTLLKCTGNYNTGVGSYCLSSIVGVDDNTGIGDSVLNSCTGARNTAIGKLAGYSSVAINNDVFIGYCAGRYETGSNSLIIDGLDRSTEAAGRTNSLIYGIFAATTPSQYLYLNSNVTVSEVLTTNGVKQNVVTKTSGYTATTGDDVIVCNSTTAFTVTLPAATGSGQTYAISNINTGAITLEGDSSDTINGDLNQTIDQWACIQVVDYAANAWVII